MLARQPCSVNSEPRRPPKKLRLLRPVTTSLVILVTIKVRFFNSTTYEPVFDTEQFGRRVRGLPAAPRKTSIHILRKRFVTSWRIPEVWFRPQIVFQMATAYDLDVARAKDLAIAIEYFHTASLLFDDLPCMDDAERRRGSPVFILHLASPARS